MNAYSIVKNETGAKPTFTPVTSGLLQRACACGQHSAGSGGECDKCKKKHEGTLQRTLVNPALALQVPPIVDDVLRSPASR